ncbi:MAG: orotidine 5'-phosphate decarboxylase / HUMPS family protein [Pelolinea sp.]|nr:orotidine 5'-phosphate decarboxylase / HUMPS family protein [Pelolinea sp.]
MLDNKTRYLQIAFNFDANMVRWLLPRIPHSNRIMIEAGTPYLKREGMAGIRYIRRFWSGLIVADLKIADGALDEVQMAHFSGANAVTVLGNAPRETINLCIEACKNYGMISMIDMISVTDPLTVIRGLRKPPDVVVLHLGRDEETTRGKLIQYRHVNRIRSKYSVLISAAGGVGVKQARSAIFNGANIVVANIIRPGGIWKGISAEEDVGEMAKKFLNEIE